MDIGQPNFAEEMTNREKLEVALEWSKRQAKGDVEFYIEKFVHIEDKDTTEVIVPFKLWPGQRRSLREIMAHKLNVALKARQLGFTWLALAYGSHGLVFVNGYTIVGLSRTEEEAKELVRRMEVILYNQPDLIRDAKEAPADWKGLTYTRTALTIEIYRPGGVTASFKAFPSAAGAGRSFTANLIIIDEWAFQEHDREIWVSAYPIINRPTGGQVIGLSTNKRGSLFEEIYSIPGNGFHKIFMGWDTDPRRTQEWYEATKLALGDKVYQEYPATAAEALSVPGGSFFPELRANIHLNLDNEPIPHEHRRYVSIDYGLDALAALWHAVDDIGDDLIYRELFLGKEAFDEADRTELIISAAAQKIIEANDGEPIYNYFAPPDLWNKRQETGRNAAEYFADYGIDLVKTSNGREQGWLDVKEWINPIIRTNMFNGVQYATSKLRIRKDACPNLWRSLTEIQKDENNPNDAASKPHNLTHLPDSLRAFCAGRPLPREMRVNANRAVWSEDMYEDYENASEESKAYLIKKWGNPF